MATAASSQNGSLSGAGGRPRERRTSRRLDLAGRTDRGRRRARNEDQFVIAELGRWMQQVSTSVGTPGQEAMSLQGTLLVVADGIGGHGGGDVASAVALDSLLGHSFRAMPWLGIGSPEGDALLRDDVERFVVSLQEQLVEVARQRNLPRMLGTTLTAGYIQNGRLILAHVGDSRAYVLRQGTLTRLTRDHTLSELEGGRESTPGSSHVLVNAIGGNADQPRPDLTSTALVSGDRVLLCTDGLYNPVSDARIAELLSTASTADQAARALIDEALARGGPDNVTVVAAFG